MGVRSEAKGIDLLTECWPFFLAVQGAFHVDYQKCLVPSPKGQPLYQSPVVMSLGCTLVANLAGPNVMALAKTN